MIIFIIAFILLLIAVSLVFQRRDVLNEIRAIKMTKTSTVKELQDISYSIKNELGIAGAFKEQVEIKGIIHSNNPITAELSKRPCVYARTQVMEKYKKTYYDDGERKTREGFNTLADNTLQINFYLEDGTGKIQVNPNEAEIELIEVVNRYELNNNQSTQGSDDKRILGYQYNEWILPLDMKVYVLGEISDSEGKLVIQKPLDNQSQFLITHKSEEQVLQEKQSKARSLKRRITFWVWSIIFMIVWLNVENQSVVNEIRAIKATKTFTVEELQDTNHTIEKKSGSVAAFKEQLKMKEQQLLKEKQSEALGQNIRIAVLVLGIICILVALRYQ
ncbi:MAG: hypothetical protein F6K10_09555 [Moorea sp. SIO2B7]|nr:hypothetical protein [Moorena sp. SIO2B7]